LPALTNFSAKGWSEKARLPPRAAMKRGDFRFPLQAAFFEVDFRNYKYISIEFPALYADLYATKRELVPDTKWHQGLSITPKFSQSHHKGKLVLGSIVELRRARGFVSRNFLGGLKRSLVFSGKPGFIGKTGWVLEQHHGLLQPTPSSQDKRLVVVAGHQAALVAQLEAECFLFL
jgi:hypothetical protein